MKWPYLVMAIEGLLLLSCIALLVISDMKYHYMRDNTQKWREDSEKLRRYNRGKTVGATPHKRKRVGVND